MLRWRKPDQYHIRSACNRFAVCRMNVGLAIWYIAWRRSLMDDGVSTEIGATRLPIAAPESERLAAIKAMQEVCEAEALSKMEAA